MATLTNTQISVTYVGLLKTSANTVLTSTAQQITDGSGNNSIMFLSTAGVGIGGAAASGKELDVTGNVLVTGDLQVDNINIDANTISATSGVVTLADGAIATTQSQNDNSTKIATTAYVDAAVDSADTLAEVLAIGNTTGTTKISVSSSSSGIDFVDSAKARFGTGNDFAIFHDGSDTNLENAVGGINITNNTDDSFISFSCDNGSGGVAEYLKIDGNTTTIVASKNITLADDVKAIFGTGSDLEIFHDGNNSIIKDSGAGNLQLNATSFVLNNSADSANMIIAIDGGAVNLYHSGSKKFETSSTGVTVTGVAVTDGLDLGDSEKIRLGNAQDVEIYHDSSDSFLVNNTGHLNIRNTADDSDIIFSSDDGSGGITEYFRCNGDNSDIIFSKPIELEDSVELRIGGSGADLRFFHSTNSFMQNFVGDLQIEQHTNDKDIFLRCDDGSGGVSTYILLDGSEVATKIETVKIFMSNLPTSNPSVAGQLYNDSGTLKISAG